MNEFTSEDMRFACDLVLFLCVLLGLLVSGACLILFLTIGQPLIDQLVSVARPIFHLIGM